MLNSTPRILAQLKILPPNHIYELASKDCILRGYDYYSHDRLESYKWNITQTQLTAYVRGGERHSVEFSLQQDELRYTCTCHSWEANTQCKHVICALLTTINILQPSNFTLPRNSSTHRNKLSANLFAKEPRPRLTSYEPERPKPNVEIVLAEHHASPEVSITKDGHPSQSFYGIPTELVLLMRGIQDPAWVSHETLLSYLNQHGNTHPLAFKTPERHVPLTWHPSLRYQTATELNVCGNTIQVQARCLLNGIVQEEARPFQRLVANLSTQTLSPLQDTSGWNVFKMLQEAFGNRFWENSSNTSHVPHRSRNTTGQRSLTRLSAHASYDFNNTSAFFIPLKTFHSIPLNLTKLDLKDGRIILKIEGEDAPLQQIEHAHEIPSLNYRLNVFPAPDSKPTTTEKSSQYVLRPEYRLGESQCGIYEPTFQFFPVIEKARDLPASFKSQKRKSILRETFFQLLATQTTTDAHRIIKESLSSNEFKMYIVKSEAKQLLTRYHASFQERDFRLAYDQNQWIIFPHDKARQVLLYAIPFEIFGHQVFRDMTKYDELTISHDILQMKLPELHARLQTAGISLIYHDKPILTSQWDFSFDAQRPPDIDWFEILPEIRCDGVVISDTTWRKTLQHGSVMETEEGVRILDVNALEILRSLSTMYPTDRTTQTKGKIINIPTLQILDWVALRKRGVQVRLSEEDEALFQQLLNFEKIPQVTLPSGLNATLRSYQKGGYDWLSFLYQHRFGACLADDMGLGKTLQAICLLAGIHEGIVTPSKSVRGPHLAVLPPSLLFNWEHEIKRFYPSLRIQWYNSTERSPTFTDCDLVLTTYGVVRRDIDTLEKIPFNVIIFDEAQAIKNIKAHSTGAARRLNGYFKLVMTGTPLENHLGEYYSLIDLSIPGLLGDYDAFRSEMKSQEPAMLEKLLQRTKPFVLRRTKGEILKELPPKIESDVYLDLTEKQKSLYQQTIASIRPTIEDAYRTKTSAQARVIALTAILKLRQVCLSPKLLNPTSTDSSPKITCLLDRLLELLDEGHSALVFSQFTSFLDLVEKDFGNHGIPYSRLDGSTPTKKRKKLVQDFQDSAQPSVFLLSLKAGGQGLNLTKASYVFHLDPWWNPAVENQASDRAHRIGQQQKVSIMRLLMHHTIEEKMMALKKHKLALYEAVMEGSTQQGTGAGITKEDFDFLLD